jgi:hypothetical protein
MNSALAQISGLPVAFVALDPASNDPADLIPFINGLRERHPQDPGIGIVYTGIHPPYGEIGAPNRILSELDLLWFNRGDRWYAWSETLELADDTPGDPSEIKFTLRRVG